MTCPTGDYAIQTREVCFAYSDGVQALADVTFRAPRGRFTAIVGANGSGKTTLLKVLLRIIKPCKGQVLLGHQDLSQLQAADLYRQVGMVFQNPADQLFGSTVEQDVAVGPRNLGLPAGEVARRVDQALAAVEADHLRYRPIHHLSFGEQKRICLAGVLAMQPSILVLDEPTAGLDPAGQTHMLDLLARLNRQHGLTVIFSTHALDLVPLLAQQVYVLVHGRVHRHGSPREIFADPALLAAAGLRLPWVAQLFCDLADDGMPAREVPLTLAEARRQIRTWFAARDASGAGGNRP